MSSVVCEEARKTQFWKKDGCINCHAYQGFREKRLQLHEAMSSCLLLGCQNFGHTVLKPFIGTHEIKEFWIKNPEKQQSLRPRIYELLRERGLNPEEVLKK